MYSWSRNSYTSSIKEVLNKYSYAIVGIVLVLIIGGSITGYSSYVSSNIDNIDELTASLDTCETSLAGCGTSKDTADKLYQECKSNVDAVSERLEDISEIQTDLSSCRGSESKLQDQLYDVLSGSTELLQNVSRCGSNLAILQNTCDNTIGDLEESYDDLAESSAEFKCCRWKDFQTDLEYYYIDDGEIECVAESDDALGTKPFAC